MRRNPNIVDKVMRFIPGYTGYAERDERRQSDAQVRARVCAALEHCEEIIRARLELELARRDESKTTAAERCRMHVHTLIDRIRHAPTGASGLMAANVVGVNEIEQLAWRDLELLDTATQLVERADNLEWPDLMSVIGQLENALDTRNGYLQELK